jgi:hypothetical protein
MKCTFFTLEFKHYAPAPRNIEEDVAAEVKGKVSAWLIGRMGDSLSESTDCNESRAGNGTALLRRVR